MFSSGSQISFAAVSLDLTFIMNTLQNIIFNQLNSDYSEQQFFFCDSGSCLQSEKDSNLIVFRHKTIATNTFFNAFDISFWNRNCVLNSLFLTVRGKGKAYLKLLVLTDNDVRTVVADEFLDLDPVKGGSSDIEIPEPARFKKGLLYFELTALSDEFVLDGGSFYTKDAPVNEVRLGIVVTHFNHQKEVFGFYSRLNAEILSDSEFKDKIRMVIVDNSQNLDSSVFENAVVLPNKNLGGSGGFTRGLMYLKENGFTNCLFMDDDGDLLLESIKRTEKIFEYVKDSQKAIAGVLLSDEQPYLTREVGAQFHQKGYVVLNHNGVDLTYSSGVIQLCEPNPFVNYGAWCYFAFNISALKYLPFPFFVRGDDIYFSLQNQFEIISEMGISCRVPSFESKESPLTRYLGVRSELLITLSHNPFTAKRTLLKSLWHRFSGQLYSYNYASCWALVRAINDIARGPDSFFKDPSAQKAREYIASLPYSEKKTAVKFNSAQFMEKDFDRRIRFRKLFSHTFFRHLSINGLLLPHACTWKTTLVVPKSYQADKKKLYRHDAVFYYDKNTDSGYFAYRDPKQALMVSISFLKAFRHLKKNYKKLSETYRNISSSEEYWNSQFKK